MYAIRTSREFTPPQEGAGRPSVGSLLALHAQSRVADRFQQTPCQLQDRALTVRAEDVGSTADRHLFNRWVGRSPAAQRHVLVTKWEKSNRTRRESLAEPLCARQHASGGPHFVMMSTAAIPMLVAFRQSERVPADPRIGPSEIRHIVLAISRVRRIAEEGRLPSDSLRQHTTSSIQRRSAAALRSSRVGRRHALIAPGL